MVSVFLGMIYCLVALHLWWGAHLNGVDLQGVLCLCRCNRRFMLRRLSSEGLVWPGLYILTHSFLCSFLVSTNLVSCRYRCCERPPVNRCSSSSRAATRTMAAW